MLKPERSAGCGLRSQDNAGMGHARRCSSPSGFHVTEAWPIDTEMAGGMRTEKASLASSIFLVGRKRAGKATGSYETTCNPNSKPSSANGSRRFGTRASPGPTWSSPASVRAYEPSPASPA